MPAAAFKLVPGMGAYKLLSYVAFPAISLFVLLGATVFSILKIRRIRDEHGPAPVDETVVRESTKQWWHDNKWGVWSVFAASVAMAWFGATWLLFLCYIVSLGLLIFVLTSFARIGLGNRLMVCQSCVLSLCFLGQLAGFPGIGDDDIHVVDQALIVPLFFSGAFVVTLIMVGSTTGSHRRAGGWDKKTRPIAPAAAFAVFLVPLTVWYMNPILWPATPARIKAYVESFDRAPFATASWHQWEIVASWAVESKLDPDLSHPRQLLDAEIAGEQNPVVLGSAFRVGLVRTDQIGRLKDYEQRRHFLFDRPVRILETRPLTSPEMDNWVIRAAVMRQDLTAEQRDYLEKRLHATLERRLDRSTRCPRDAASRDATIRGHRTPGQSRSISSQDPRLAADVAQQERRRISSCRRFQGLQPGKCCGRVTRSDLIRRQTDGVLWDPRRA